MGLTLAERETIVSMNDAGDIAYVYSAQPRIIGRLRRNQAAVLTEEGVYEGAKWARFEIPAKLVSFRSVRITQNLTDEQRAARRERLARVSRARNAPSGADGGAESDFQPAPGLLPGGGGSAGSARDPPGFSHGEERACTRRCAGSRHSV